MTDTMKLVVSKVLEVGILKNSHIMQKEISMITMVVDKFNVDTHTQIRNKHIDIDFAYGEYLEIHEGSEDYSTMLNIFKLKEIDMHKTTILFYDIDMEYANVKMKFENSVT